MDLLKNDVEHCRKINKKFGKGYYFATQFFNKDVKEATYVLYAFFRLPDEIVDNPKNNPHEELNTYIKNWEDAIEKEKSNHSVLRATLAVHKKYQIPYQYSLDFLQAMNQDLEKERYTDFEDLKKYIYGSATCVGYMMSYLIGFNKEEKEKVLKHAEELAIAMQMTNFLRDIKEDYVLRNRIYMPQDELSEFNISEIDIKQRKVFKDFMKFQIQRCREYYKSAELNGIPLLDSKGRLPVLLASKIYSEILTEIEKNDYDIFSKRVKVSFIRKLLITFDTIVGYGK